MPKLQGPHFAGMETGMPRKRKMPTLTVPEFDQAAVMTLARALARRAARKAAGTEAAGDHRKKPRKKVLKPREG